MCGMRDLIPELPVGNVAVRVLPHEENLHHQPKLENGARWPPGSFDSRSRGGIATEKDDR